MAGRVATSARLERSPDLEPRSRAYGRDERVFDAAVHAVGGVLAFIGAMMLLRSAGGEGWARFLPIAVYSTALVTTFAASAAYNLFFDTPFRPLLRRIDHSAIFLMIAGTYTPFTVILGRGPEAVGSTVFVWTVALLGIALKLLRSIFFERVCVAFYLALGWSSIVILPDIASRLPEPSLLALAAGGLLYTAGLYFHLMERMRFHNAIWHVFVVAAAACHFVSVYLGVALAGS